MLGETVSSSAARGSRRWPAAVGPKLWQEPPQPRSQTQPCEGSAPLGEVSPPAGGASACHWPLRPLGVSQQVSVAWKRVRDTFTDKLSTSETRTKVSQTEWNLKARRHVPHNLVWPIPPAPVPRQWESLALLLAGALTRGGEHRGEAPTPVRHIFSDIKIPPLPGGSPPEVGLPVACDLRSQLQAEAGSPPGSCNLLLKGALYFP